MFCSVHSWENGTRCSDGVNVLWHYSHLVSLVLEGYMRLFSFRFVPTFCCCFRNGKREERWEGRARGRCMVCKASINVHYFVVHKEQTVVVNQMLSSEIVNPSIKLFYRIWSCCSYSATHVQLKILTFSCIGIHTL